MEPSAVSIDQALLRPDMDVIQEYARDHPEDWADVRWENEPPVRIVVRFAGRVEQHHRALAGLLQNPERLEVGPARYTNNRLSAVQAEIQSRYRGRGLRGSATLDNKVRITLATTALAIADEIHHSYGDMVAITVGVLPYPPGSATLIPMGDPPVALGSLPVRLSLVLGTSPVVAGEDGHGRLHVTNVGASPLRVMTGVVLGWVYGPGGDHPVSCYSGPVTSQGFVLDLAPGETSARTPVLFGTASHDPGVGYHLAPGPYEVVAVFEGHEDPEPTDHTDRSIERFCIHAPRTSVTLT